LKIFTAARGYRGVARDGAELVEDFVDGSAVGAEGGAGEGIPPTGFEPVLPP
jgi:hypothetical protein